MAPRKWSSSDLPETLLNGMPGVTACARCPAWARPSSAESDWGTDLTATASSWLDTGAGASCRLAGTTTMGAGGP